jgi:hypothetical protein
MGNHALRKDGDVPSVKKGIYTDQNIPVSANTFLSL